MMPAVEQHPEEQRVHQTFETLMWALAEPGSVRKLPRPGLEDIAEALVDIEVTIFTPDPRLMGQLRRTGATQTVASEADYLFIPGSDAFLPDIVVEARTGEPLYPDRAATIVLGADIGSGEKLRLTGPGVDGTCEVLLGGPPAAFWDIRARICRYPLGWDVFFVDGVHVMGLPRSTVVEVLP